MSEAGAPLDSPPDAEHLVKGDKENELENEANEHEHAHLEFMNRNMTFEEHKSDDEVAAAQEQLIKNSEPSTELEVALYGVLERKNALIERITAEIDKLKSFCAKRKQTYKRKRKDDGAPTRALSAYNIFIQERFAQLAKENEKALKSDDANAELKRVPPSNLVSKTGNEWKELSAEVKAGYEERAKVDRKRYEEQMAQYNPPDKQSNRKRNKTGYNMFFSAHVLRLKQTESGVPSERGSVARLVGSAWKQLSQEDKQYYEREADKHNGMNPVKDDEEEEEEEAKAVQVQMEHQYPAYQPEMHLHANIHGMQHAQHDPRTQHHHGYYAQHVYAQNPYGHYDYSQHHQRQPQGRAAQQQQQQQQYQYPPAHARHPYEQIL